MKLQPSQPPSSQIFKVPDIISDSKLQALKYNMFQTLTGLNSKIYTSCVNMVLVLVAFSGFLAVFGLEQVGYGASIGVNIGVCVLVSIIYCSLPNNSKTEGKEQKTAKTNTDLNGQQNQQNLQSHQQTKQTTNIINGNFIIKVVISGIYGFCWAHHLHYCLRGYKIKDSDDSSLISTITILVLSYISIFLSIGCILLEPVRQFSSPSLYVTQTSPYSTRYIRFLLPFMPLMLIQVILDFVWQSNQSDSTQSPNPSQLAWLQCIRGAISLVWTTWVFGWMSTIYNVYCFVLNNINRFVLGEQDSKVGGFIMVCVSLIVNCIPIIAYSVINSSGANISISTIWILFIGATISSIVIFFNQSIWLGFNVQRNTQQRQQQKCFISTRSGLMIAIQSIVSVGLVLLLVFLDLSSIPIQIVCGIDIGLYLGLVWLWDFCTLPRNWFGMRLGLEWLSQNNKIVFIEGFKRVVLRVASGITILVLVQSVQTEQLVMYIKSNVTLYTTGAGTIEPFLDTSFIQYFAIPVLFYRSFKRSLSNACSFSLHFSIFLCLVINLNQLSSDSSKLIGILAVLIMPPFPHNFYMIFVAPFTTPPKMKREHESCYNLMYLAASLAGAFVHIFSLGMLQFSMVFGLPMFYCVLPTFSATQTSQQNDSQIKSKQGSLYLKIISNLPEHLFTFHRQGFYLLRVEKYIVLVQVKQECYGFGEVLQFRGFQVQEVTSCHSKEGDTIDRIVEETWGQNAEFMNFSHLQTVLAPLKKFIANVPTQNQIQLTGIIESKQFVEVFKKAVLVCLAEQVVIESAKYTTQQYAQGQQLIEELNYICKQEKYEQFFPKALATEMGLEFQYPKIDEKQRSILKVRPNKLAPISVPGGKKPTIANDFMDLLSNQPLNSSPNVKHAAIVKNQNEIPLEKAQDSNVDLTTGQKQKDNQLSQQKQKKQKRQLNVALIMTLYHYSIGKFDYVNVQKLFNQINKDKDDLSQVRFDNALKILSKALAKGFKIAIDKATMGETEINQLTDFKEYQKQMFLGIAGSEEFNKAIQTDIKQIWTLNYAKGNLSIKRLAKSEIQTYMFKADPVIIKSVWNNLQFELIYAHNDNDERYSIQTHPSLMRNLWVEGCSEPFGYPSYMSGLTMNDGQKN